MNCVDGLRSGTETAPHSSRRTRTGLAAGISAMAAAAFLWAGPALAVDTLADPADEITAAEPTDTPATLDPDGADAETAPSDLDAIEEKDGAKELRFTLAVAPEPESPAARATDFLRGLLEAAFKVRNDETMDDDQRYTAFQDLLSEGLAIDFLSRLMLGRHRRDATPDQITAYNAVFPGYITSLYASQLVKLTKVDMSVIDIVSLNGQDVLVRTRLDRQNGEPITVDWRIRDHEAGNLEIVDIAVEGASIMMTKRDEFNALVTARGFDALIAELEDRSDTETTSTAEQVL